MASGERDLGLLGAYGHSWVSGAGATRPEYGFAARAAAALDLSLDNRAQSATVSIQNATAVVSDPPPPTRLFVLMTGLNDARLHGESVSARRDYADNLQSILAVFAANGAASVIALAQPYLIDYSGYAPFDRGSDSTVEAYNAVLADVMSGHDFARVAVAEEWDPQTMLAADGVHPNDRGHAQLARTVAQSVGCIR